MRTSYRTKVITAIITLSMIGVALSGYMLAIHYQAGPSFCAIGTVVNCDTVNKGPYGEIGGIPVALLGIIGYLAIATAAWYAHLGDNRALWMTRVLATLGLLFSLWLLYLELFVILAICPFCMTSLIVITLITGLIWGASSFSTGQVDPSDNSSSSPVEK